MGKCFTLQYERSDGKGLNFLKYDTENDALLGAVGLSMAGDQYRPLRILTPNGAVAVSQEQLTQHLEQVNEQLQRDSRRARAAIDKARRDRRTQQTLETIEGYGTW